MNEIIKEFTPYYLIQQQYEIDVQPLIKTHLAHIGMQIENENPIKKELEVQVGLYANKSIEMNFADVINMFCDFSGQLIEHFKTVSQGIDASIHKKLMEYIDFGVTMIALVNQSLDEYNLSHESVVSSTDAEQMTKVYIPQSFLNGKVLSGFYYY